MSISIIRYNSNNPSFTERDIFELIKSSYRTREKEGLRFVFCNFLYEDFIRRFNCIDDVVIIAIDNNQDRLVGTISMRLKMDSNSGEIFWLAVSPEARGMGISQRLFREIIHIAQEKGLSYLQSDTATGAKSSIKAHKKSGFKITGLTSFRSTKYYSFIFRLPISKASKYHSTLYCRLSYVSSLIKTIIQRKADGTDSFFYKYYCKVRRQVKALL